MNDSKYKGNMSEVYRDGDMVCRDRKPQSDTIARLLLHLEKKGITFVPRHLGIKDEKREMLSFVEGNTIDNYPIQSDIEMKIVTVRSVAKMLKEYHDATVDFQKSPDDCWFLQYDGDLPKEVICHNDIAPYNMTFEGNHPVGMIDFDTACPAPRIWDIAYAVYRFVPLSKYIYDPSINQYRDYDKSLDCSERRFLLHTFLEAYGIEDTNKVLQNVILRLEALVQLFDEECSKGTASFIKMKAEGHQQLYIDEIAFIRENMHDWSIT